MLTTSHRSLFLLALLGPLAACPTDEAPVDDTDTDVDADGPSAPDVAITPEAPTTVDDLVAEVASPIPGGDYTFRWFLGGTQQVVVDPETVPSDVTAKGDVWSVEVIVEVDGVRSPAGTAEVTIGNASPVVTGITLTPGDEAGSDEDLVAEATGTDPDGDPVSFVYEWCVEGGSICDGGDAALDPEAATLDAGFTARGEVWTVTAWAYDTTGTERNEAEGAFQSRSVDIVNAAPTIRSLAIAPAMPRTNQTLTATANLSDADGDQNLTTAWSWFKNGSSTPVQTGAGNTLAPVNYVKHDMIEVEVTVSDVFGAERTQRAGPVEIRNSLPTFDAVAITVDDQDIEPLGVATTLTDLRCNPTGWQDADGDLEGYTFSWWEGGVNDLGVTDAVLPAGTASKGQSITCRAQAFDGEGYGVDTLTSPAVVIGNAWPTLTSASLLPAFPSQDDTLTATPAGGADPDGDAVSFRYAWFRNTLQLAGQTGSTLSGVFGPGDAIYAVVTPFDGTDEGVSVQTATVAVENRRPTVDSLVLTPSPLRTGNNVFADAVATDPDGQDVTLTYLWRVNNVPVSGVSGAILPASRTNRGDEVRVSVIANDGLLDSLARTTTAIVANTPPSITNASLSPTTADVRSTLTCDGVAWSDPDSPDNSNPGYRYAWVVNDIDVTGATAATLAQPDFRRGDAVRCRLTPWDGVDEGLAVLSNTVIIRNAPPSIEEVVLDDYAPFTGVPITATANGVVDADTDPVTLQYEWTVNDGVVSGVVTNVLPADRYGPGDVVIAGVRASDGTSFSPWSYSEPAIAVNTEPRIDALVLGPANANTTDDLVAELVWVDPDGGTPTITYTWYQNGSEIPSVTGDTFPSSLTVRGDEVEVSVRVEDADGGFDEDITPPLLVLNAPPAITGIEVTPAAPDTTTPLTCVAQGWSDADGDDEGYLYEWTVNLAQAGFQGTLPATAFSKGDVVSCRITPDDGFPGGRGAFLETAPFVIGNAPPTLDAVTLTPDDPNELATIAALTGVASDPDGEGVAFTYRWMVDDTDVPVTGPSLTGAHFDKGDEVQVEVTPSDGTDAGLPVLSNVLTVVNTPPTVNTVFITPVGASTTDDLVADVNASDLDGDPLTYTYTWTVDGSPVVGATTDTLPTGNFTAGSAVTVTVRANDGEDDSVDLTSPQVVIDNTPPSITSVSITPTEIREGTVATCVPDGWFDPDGDPPAYIYTWYRNSGSFAGGSATLNGNAFDRGDTIWCEVTPIDGGGQGNPVASGTVVILNTAPTATGASLTRANPREADTVGASLSGQFDVDGDPLTRTTTWFVNGAELTGVGTTINGTRFDKGDEIQARIVLSDGELENTYWTETTIAVNTLPRVEDVSLTPESPRVTDAVVVGYTIIDPDPEDVGDLTASFAWEIDTLPVSGQTSDTLPAGAFAKRDVIEAIVTPSDGVGTGTPVRSGTVTAVNSPPTVTSASISPIPLDARGPATCTGAGAADADGDLVSLRYSWTRNGNTVGGSVELQPSAFARNDVIRCFVIPEDDQETGAAVGSDSVTVVNAPPAIAGVSLTTTFPTIDDVVDFQITGISDADGDIVQRSISWKVNGVHVYDSRPLTSAYFTRGDEIWVEITPNDGFVDGATVTSDSAFVVNQPPELVAPPSISPDPLYTQSIATASASGTDTEGDGVSFAWRWFVDGVEVPGATGPTLDGAFVFDRGQEVMVEATPFDGIDYGTPLLSDPEPVANSRPSTPEISIGPAAPAPGVDDIVCTIDELAEDADGDTLAYQWRWSVKEPADLAFTEINFYVNQGTSSYVPGGFTSSGETYKCEVRANDGTGPAGNGSWSTAALAQIDVQLRTSCGDYNSQGNPDGVYSVDPDGTGPLSAYEVYCDQTTEGGGWTRILRTSGYDVDYGQRTYDIVSSYVGVSATDGVYDAFRLQADWEQLMIKAVTGPQAGDYMAFSVVSGGLTMLETLEACRDEALYIGNTGGLPQQGSAQHVTRYGGTYFGTGTLSVHYADGSPAQLVRRAHVCTINLSDDDDVSYLAFTHEDGTFNSWGDGWRGQDQVDTIWSFANGDYCCTGDTHIGASGLEALAGWKGQLGTDAQAGHQATYELYVR